MSELWNGDKGIVDLRSAANVIALSRIAARTTPRDMRIRFLGSIFKNRLCKYSKVQ
jgi:hypothetical protein